jgi:retron-type reverse transcriptase
MSVPPGTIPFNYARPTPTRAEDPNALLQEGQYETSVPVIMDRCHQARVRNALEPEWEARFEPKSYGFRPGRSCQDAIEALFNTMSGKNAKRLWVLDADLSAALDASSHCSSR